MQDRLELYFAELEGLRPLLQAVFFPGKNVCFFYLERSCSASGVLFGLFVVLRSVCGNVESRFFSSVLFLSALFLAVLLLLVIFCMIFLIF